MPWSSRSNAVMSLLNRFLDSSSRKKSSHLAAIIIKKFDLLSSNHLIVIYAFIIT